MIGYESTCVQQHAYCTHPLQETEALAVAQWWKQDDVHMWRPGRHKRNSAEQDASWFDAHHVTLHHHHAVSVKQCRESSRAFRAARPRRARLPVHRCCHPKLSYACRALPSGSHPAVSQKILSLHYQSVYILKRERAARRGIGSTAFREQHPQRRTCSWDIADPDIRSRNSRHVMTSARCHGAPG